MGVSTLLSNKKYFASIQEDKVDPNMIHTMDLKNFDISVIELEEYVEDKNWPYGWKFLERGKENIE